MVYYQKLNEKVLCYGIEFKPVVAGDIDRLRPLRAEAHHKICDSVFLDSFVEGLLSCTVRGERGRRLWLMEKDQPYHSHICAGGGPALLFQQMVDYFQVCFAFYISLADEEAVQCLNLDRPFLRWRNRWI